MPRRINPQSRSVGNLGDILKHAALVALARWLADARGSVRWVDTHAYLIDALPADGEGWAREIDRLVARHPAYAGYAAIERQSLARTGRYRCSSGLALEVLGDRRISLTLGEADAATRDALREQVTGLANVHVAADAVAALRVAATARGGAVLVHVDPFSLTTELWTSLAPHLDALCEHAEDAIIVAYRYTRAAPSAWPGAPRGVLGPVARTRGGPHELAAYASSAIVGDVEVVLGTLGWR